MEFKKATKKQAKARIALLGPSGCGKTYTALQLATGFGGRVALVDTEHGSASKYADLFDFDALELADFNPRQYIEAIHAAEGAGYDVLIIDSLSHAWAGKGGILEYVDQVAKQQAAKSGRQENKFAAWGEATPLHNQLIEAMLASKFHLIVTMRTKMEYVQEKDDKGKTSIRKVGIQPVQRDGMEYEFDVVADMDLEHYLVVSKTRCVALDGRVVQKPGPELARELAAWLGSGVAVPQPAPKVEPPPVATGTQTPATGLTFDDLKSASGNGHASHWIDDSTARATFWKWVKGQGLTEADAHTRLGISSMHEFTGTAREACEKIKAWKEPEPEPAPDGEQSQMFETAANNPDLDMDRAGSPWQ